MVEPERALVVLTLMLPWVTGAVVTVYKVVFCLKVALMVTS